MNELQELVIKSILQPQHSTMAEKTQSSLLNKYVIVRCRDAGVWAGYLTSRDGRCCVLKDARRLWLWQAADEHTLSGVVRHGLKTDESKLSGPVEIVELLEACEVIPVTDKGKASILAQPIHNKSN